MAQRTGFVILAAMATAGRNGFNGTGSVPFSIVASAAQMARTGYGLSFPLCALGPVRSRRLAALLRVGPQTKEPRPVPPGAGNENCDFGEVAKGLPVIGKAFRQHHHPIAFAFPFPDQDRAGLDPARQHDLAARLPSICLHHLVEQALSGSGEAAIGLLLNPMSDAAPKQIGTECLWRVA